MSPFVPEYGTSDYARWRAQVTPDSLRWFIDVTDSSVMQMLRATLSAGSGGAEFCKSSNEQLLHLLARRISGGDLAVFGQPTRGSHPSQWLCSDSHVPFYARNGHTARPVPAARGVWVKPDLVEEVVAAVAKATEVQRYRLFVALAYEHTKHVCANKTPVMRVKWEHEFTGPETRRSGPVEPSDAARSDLGYRDMRAGNYKLELRNDKKFLELALAPSALKAKRS